MTNHAGVSRRNGYRDPASDIGWADYAAGWPFPADYDTWSRKRQRNYENGRLRAANYVLATGAPPPRQQVARSIYIVTCRRVGSATP